MSIGKLNIIKMIILQNISSRFNVIKKQRSLILSKVTDSKTYLSKSKVGGSKESWSTRLKEKQAGKLRLYQLLSYKATVIKTG